MNEKDQPSLHPRKVIIRRENSEHSHAKEIQR
jgi:hypothetical protein